jgi:hypothetical protein
MNDNFLEIIWVRLLWNDGQPGQAGDTRHL